MSHDTLISTGEAAALVGVSDETLRRWAADKRVRHTRTPSGRLLFDPADLAEFFTVVEPVPAGSVGDPETGGAA